MPRRLNIGVITKNEQDNYFGAILDSIHKTLSSENCNMFVIYTYMLNKYKSKPGEGSIYHKLALNHVDGWIVLADSASKEHIRTICDFGRPVVTISCENVDSRCRTINEDNLYGAGIATQHLIDHGHEKIAFIGKLEFFDMAQRFEGYKRTLEENKINYDDRLFLRVDSSWVETAKKAVGNAINNGLSFTAIVAANDYLAMGAMEAIKECGMRVPEDVAVIGYDNYIHASNCSPALTSIDQNVSRKGIAAVESILEAIRGERQLKKDIYLKPELVIRNSCGCKVEENINQYTAESLRLKDLIINFMEKYQEKYYIMGTNFLTMDINDIKKLLPSILEDSSWECLGVWEEEKNQKSELFINQIIDTNSKTNLYLNIKCPIEDFPPQKYLPDLDNLSLDDVVWICPITSSLKDWGIISYVRPISEVSSLLVYDSCGILLSLLGVFMDREVANSRLKDTLDNFEENQAKLINSEKMEALSKIVAGVAHEINSPVGVSITAASFLMDKLQQVQELFDSERLKANDFKEYMATCSETVKILLMNLNRASNIITNFKQVAVGQSIEDMKKFEVKKLINEVLLSLNPKLKETRIEISVKCPDDLEIYSYPGELSQIITNFIENSLTHAYDQGQTGKILIEIYLEDNMVNIIYTDDGKGIEKTNLGKIFDPFYTTRRGCGGTGLGLNIVYNIVTHKLRGNINCTSEQGIGTTFIIKFPLREG
jgi:DNA-binding LacI/PurR family transcriptional regulator/signal transduction histidine kinase